MSTPQQLLYSATVNKCEEIYLIPWTQTFITLAFTTFFYIFMQRIASGNGIFAFIVTGITLAWYIVCFIVGVYRDYMFYDKYPDYEVFARCLLNREYNDHLFLKLMIMNVLSQKFVACLIRLDGKVSITVFRVFMRLVALFGIPALVARSVAALGAGIGMGWPFIYFWIPSIIQTVMASKINANPGFLYLAGAEAMITGSDEQQDAAAAIMTIAEGALIAEGEDVPSGSAGVTGMNAPDTNNGDTAGTTTTKTTEEEDKHAKLNFFADYFDQTSVWPRILQIICYSVTTYYLVISWDWRYDENGITYSQAFSAFDAYRPTAQKLYDNRDQLTAAQAGYIASTFA